MPDEWIPIGRVRSVNPRSRELRVKVRDGYSYVFDDLAWIRFERAPGDVLRCKVTASKGDKSVAAVTLSPGVPRDVVGLLRGCVAVLAPDELPPPPGGRSVLDDWLGLRVVLPSGESLGLVCEVFEGPANDAFAVQRPDGSRCILPVIDAVVRAINIDGGMIEVGDVEPFVVEA